MLIELKCPCDGCSQSFITIKAPIGLSEKTIRRSWKNYVSQNNTIVHCNCCKCSFKLEDDNVDVDSGGYLTLSDKSKPVINSISLSTSGPEDGGTVVRIHGDALNVDGSNLVVKFGDVLGTNLSIISREVIEITSPAGSTGFVNISVENDNGQHSDGSSILENAFRYI